jgi:hypothetical protein
MPTQKVIHTFRTDNAAIRAAVMGAIDAAVKKSRGTKPTPFTCAWRGNDIYVLGSFMASCADDLGHVATGAEEALLLPQVEVRA